jgi:ABC-type nitrate/sulfonate/bicarbonate transport system permease component
MKRLLHALVFFALLVVVWHFFREFMVKSGRWSPVLVPTPLAVRQSRFAVGITIFRRCGDDERLLLGYIIGVMGVPLGLLTARFKWAGTRSACSAWLADCRACAGAAGAVVVWADRDGYAVRGDHGHALVSANLHRHGVRNVRDLCARGANGGLARLHAWVKVFLPASLPHIVSGINRLGLRVAFAPGGGRFM